ncbi:TPA: sulfite exporter TauE/SafE family protein [Staphylococcus aureus]|nr:sulfite exporter TauE/SafE family protein [Staphylococcus aureus]HDN0131600.1 sulfite exporter TauE/SafE family protein [Staphylococcus aureus]HDN0605474.1 sulfite exporter TauE/SafE family protein [Staphylococcus aureus]HDN0915933.1 sulfite exporter TauE/SafE family protein [Staphylococcus aureus]HDN0938692.1 sulfite exporter TauE/SafE family protein [Staphylococcus aureus]
MDIVNIVIMLLIGVFGGFISGLVGVGGAIIIYPAILLLPPLFGAPAYSAYIASGLTSSQVFFSTLSGSLKARKKTEFSPQLVLYMGGGMIIGSMLGAGGAFIIIPILLVLFKLPMNTVVANSIVIAFISSIGAFVIKLIQGYIPLYDALFLIIGSIIFAPIGLKLSKKVPNIIQKWIISILIVFAIVQLIL